ncbi:hypothetical protein PpBr36_08819 [Pyricularia pennisetigena]|uniref:hypothetical protein n=1 Tax=Pyricularia pennisetigena TaxID=1578925 RepID=UPI0011548DED|nr:hypothetical protein PpBr36_08819 [Pyricularia pennisetigena]TLS24722.1 hypothetical protein PpBr36_08819 [Pyricularia pennisetigena]
MLVLKQIAFLLLPLVSHLANAYPISAQDRPVTDRDLVSGAAGADDDHRLKRRAEPAGNKSRWSSSSSSGRSSIDAEPAGSQGPQHSRMDSEGSQRTEASNILKNYVIIDSTYPTKDTPPSPVPENPGEKPMDLGKPLDLNKPLPKTPSEPGPKKPRLFSKLGSKNSQPNLKDKTNRPTISRPTLQESSTGFSEKDSKEPAPMGKLPQKPGKPTGQQSLNQGSSSSRKHGNDKNFDGGFI